MKKIILISVVAVVALTFLFYVFCLNHIEVNEIGVVRHSLTGKLDYQTNVGWYVTSPFTSVMNLYTGPKWIQLQPPGPWGSGGALMRLKIDQIPQYIQTFGFKPIAHNQYYVMAGYLVSNKTNQFFEILP